MAINICIRIALSAAISCVALPALAQAGETVAAWTAKPAHAWTAPTHMMLMDAARAGRRVVTVGEHGLVLLSDDDGRTWRQARSVPVAATLSAVTFVDAGHGWAVGQWGVILATSDGGETWHKQRLDLSTDQPLFSVAFTSPNDGIAVGLWSLMLATHDGGKTWERVTLPKPPGGGKADRNLYHIFFRWQGRPLRRLRVRNGTQVGRSGRELGVRRDWREGHVMDRRGIAGRPYRGWRLVREHV